MVDFDPSIGHEIQKRRPAVVLQNDVANRYSPVTVVAAITSRAGEVMYPTEVSVGKGEGGLATDSVVLLNQIRTIDRRRLLRRLGTITPGSMWLVDRALAVSLGLVHV